MRVNPIWSIENQSTSEKLLNQALEDMGFDYMYQRPLQCRVWNDKEDTYADKIFYIDFSVDIKGSDNSIRRVWLEIDGSQHFIYVRKFKRPLRINVMLDNIKNTKVLKLGDILIRIPGLDSLQVLGEIEDAYTQQDAYTLYLKEILDEVFNMNKVPQHLIQIYEKYSRTNYAKIARQMNEGGRYG